jgi:hypothetical protein
MVFRKTGCAEIKCENNGRLNASKKVFIFEECAIDNISINLIGSIKYTGRLKK